MKVQFGLIRFLQSAFSRKKWLNYYNTADVDKLTRDVCAKVLCSTTVYFERPKNKFTQLVILVNVVPAGLITKSILLRDIRFLPEQNNGNF